MPPEFPGRISLKKLLPYLPGRGWQMALVALAGLIGAGVAAITVVVLILTPTLPSLDALDDARLKVPLRVYTSDGVLLAEFGEEKRMPVKVADMPEQLVQAILAAEDDSFYRHSGVDFSGIARALIANLRAGGRAEGASTITMQVARNYFLSPEKTYTRKMREILLAFKLEREFSKDEILELYVNKIFLGNRAYGFGAAAQIYFGKELKDLTLPEMATLAAIPKAPSRMNPLANPGAAADRRAYVLKRMWKLGFIEPPVLEMALKTPIVASRHTFRYEVEAPYVAEMARQYMFDTYAEKSYAGGYHVYTTLDSKMQKAAERALRKALLDYDHRHGYRGPAGRVPLAAKTETEALDEILRDYPASGPLLPAIVIEVRDKSLLVYAQNGERIEIPWEGLSWAARYLSEDARGALPQSAADIARRGDVIHVEPLDAAGWRLAQIPAVSGALTALDPKTGAILALAGGFDFERSKFNRAIQAERQPGSALKPFLYSSALDKGFTPATVVSGAPIVFENQDIEEEWRPENFSGDFYGPTRVRKALTLSMNLVSIRILRAVGTGYAVEYLSRFGFHPDRLPRDLTLALGTASVTPLELTTAFAVFANGGQRVSPYYLTRIEDSEHKVLERANPSVACELPDCPADVMPTGDSGAARIAPRVISAENAFLMTSMLRDVISAGTGQGALALGRKDLSGKTGTTNDQRDAWFAGFNRKLVAAAWVGFDQPAPLGHGEVGGRAALPMWVDFMRGALDGTPDEPIAPPPGIVTAFINRDTGKPTNPDDPQSMVEYFMDGTIPSAEAGEVIGDPDTGSGESIREGLF